VLDDFMHFLIHANCARFIDDLSVLNCETGIVISRIKLKII